MPEPSQSLSELQRQRRKKRRHFTFVTILCLICGIFFGTAWILFRSPLLRAERVDIEVAKPVSTAWTRRALIDENALRVHLSNAVRAESGWRSFLGDLHFWAWPEEFSTSTFAKIPIIKKAAVRKEFLNNRIVVAVTERAPVGIWCTSLGEMLPGSVASGTVPNACAWFDEDGMRFEEAPDGEGSLFTVVHDHSARELISGDPILPGEMLQRFFLVLKVVRQSDVGIKDIVLPVFTFQELEVSTYEGPTLYFSLRFSSEKTQEVLKTLKARNDFAALHYVDFRVEGRVYYR